MFCSVSCLCKNLSFTILLCLGKIEFLVCTREIFHAWNIVSYKHLRECLNESEWISYLGRVLVEIQGVRSVIL